MDLQDAGGLLVFVGIVMLICAGDLAIGLTLIVVGAALIVTDRLTGGDA